jgi:hypothetical protein
MQTCLEINPKTNCRQFFRRSPVQSEQYSEYFCVLTSHLDRRSKLARHHIERPQPSCPRQIRYPIAGSDRIESVSYVASDRDAEEGTVWINPTQYFQGISSKIWNLSLGGQHPCQKWLQAREHSTLSDRNIQQYQHIVTLLSEMVELMEQIDSVLPK